VSESFQRLEEWKVERQQLRARVQWKAHGDRGTKEFYRTMKPRTSQAHITELLNANGERCHDQLQLEEICYTLYSRLYQRRPVDPTIARMQRDILTRTRPKLTKSMAALL
jgi:hypothetical protein